MLQGLLPGDAQCSMLQLFHISSSTQVAEEQVIIPEVRQLLDEFTHLFAEPTELLPWRDYDHTISLIPSASPVAARQYRYAPTLKSEIGDK